MIVLYLLVLMVVRLVSYNSHGLGPAKLDYIAKLCSLYDFILVQKHWLLEQNLAIFSDQISGTCCHGVSAVDSSILLQGRPHGGCSILWSSSLTCKVTPVTRARPYFGTLFGNSVVVLPPMWLLR